MTNHEGESHSRRSFHDPAYFEAMFAADPDPWGFHTRYYEQRKYALSVASLPRERYERAYEPGCATGALTELLAGRCDEVIAVHLVESVAQHTGTRLGEHDNIVVAHREFPLYWPAGTGDLLVLSGIGYYLTDAGAELAAEGMELWLRSHGDLLAVHYTGETDYPRGGAEVARWLDSLGFLERLVTHQDRGFELGVWRRINSDPIG